MLNKLFKENLTVKYTAMWLIERKSNISVYYKSELLDENITVWYTVKWDIKGRYNTII